jgi:hypothetical protein
LAATYSCSSIFQTLSQLFAMKKHFKIQSVLAFVLIAFNQLFAASAAVLHPSDSTIVETTANQEGTYFTLRKGTTITLRLVEAVNSKEMDQGNLVNLEVYGDVMVDGMVLIATGTYAEGEIVKKRKPGVFGRGAVIHVNAGNLRTVDGQRIGLRSKGVKKTGANRAFFACSASTIIPLVGLALTNPWFVPFVATGLLVKGKDAEMPKGTVFTAFISEDVLIKA